MSIETPTTDEASAITDLWVDLAWEQRQYDSHILAEENRARITENVTRAIVTGGMRVARAETGDSAGEIVGFVMFSTGDGRFETTMTRGTIENLYVRPAERNQGIGSDLLAAATEAMRERGVDAIKLEVMADNKAARRFYRRHGFEPHRVEMERPVESDTHSRDGA